MSRGSPEGRLEGWGTPWGCEIKGESYRQLEVDLAALGAGTAPPPPITPGPSKEEMSSHMEEEKAERPGQPGALLCESTTSSRTSAKGGRPVGAHPALRPARCVIIRLLKSPSHHPPF